MQRCEVSDVLAGVQIGDWITPYVRAFAQDLISRGYALLSTREYSSSGGAPGAVDGCSRDHTRPVDGCHGRQVRSSPLPVPPFRRRWATAFAALRRAGPTICGVPSSPRRRPTGASCAAVDAGAAGRLSGVDASSSRARAIDH